MIWLIKDWKENSDGAIGRYGVEREIIPTIKMSDGYEMLKRRLTGWTFEANAIRCLLPVVGEGSSESTGRMWCCTCVPSCHAREVNQKCEAQEMTGSYQCCCSDKH